ncbi:hypothetical protein ASF53_12440 [Methylobacterium sp. Leaf123]|uniref:hypothetical protein n=1 Tax=Methylobacterium sp. Leaf123 TaxID=1736264 RepID=UPI0006FE6841|nr:hypothetical protein [Methylobacterium sp. Leaf123]KQQ13007.1 hypothetical protein ASF53_12440 [Methylobacterium sp. Leaf123]
MASSRHAKGRTTRAALRRGLGFGLLAALLSGAGLQAAAAQGFYREIYGPPRVGYLEDDGLLPSREVVDDLRDRGFSEIGRPRYDGRNYRVEATGPRGQRVRLVVDAREGDVIGREPLGGVYYPSDRVRPAAPGYGWTEEDMRPRRPVREAERIMPPADIPSVPGLRATPPGGERSAVRAERVPPATRPDANPLGVNPDVATRSEQPRRAAARTAPTPKLPSQARIAPTAPEPSLRSGSPAMTPAAKTERDKTETKEAKAVEPKLSEPRPETGKADTKTEAAKPELAKDATKTAESKPAAGKGWQDPPADGPRKNVRVIGGATIVPGGTGEASGAE